MANDNDTRPRAVSAFLLNLPVQISYDQHPEDVRAAAISVLSGVRHTFDPENVLHEYPLKQMQDAVYTLLQSVEELLKAARKLEAPDMEALREADVEQLRAHELAERERLFIERLEARFRAKDTEAA